MGISARDYEHFWHFQYERGGDHGSTLVTNQMLYFLVY